jgi:glucosyl-3-phosphoglycerate synthase
VPTLHAIGTRRPRADDVAQRARVLGRSVTLILPALATEVDGVAMPRILRHLARHPLVDRVILVLGPGTADQECRAEELVSALTMSVSLVRLGDPALQGLRRRAAAAGFDAAADGKGHACWVGLCVALAGPGSDIIAMHDCDIATYHPSLVTRLVAPLLMPAIPFDFAKGYYPRVTSTLHGRVTRLLIAPLLRALQSVGVASTLPAFMADFRYPLAGEVAFSRRLAETLPIHGGWGLEIGTLAEVYRRQHAFPICQIDIADAYDHRHRPMGTGSDDGVTTMTEELVATLVHVLRREQVMCDARTLRYVLTEYRTHATHCVHAYAADAAVNGLAYDTTQEAALVASFAGAIDRCLTGPCAEPPVYPSWQQLQQHVPRVCSAFAEIGDASTLPAPPPPDQLGWMREAAS